MRICRTCDREFKPSSGHKDCPSCRAKARRVPCPSCGSLKNAEYALCSSCVDHSGENNGNYKGGGRWVDSKGYVMLKIDGRYIYEHRLAMENHIGRKLLRSETVHHRNGVKTDNDIRNLELWSSAHPSGQRVADKVEWAKDILRLYEPDSLVVDLAGVEPA